ncbi:MAG: hypothetical protein OHK0048_09550 [Rhodoferax sp.]
MPIYAYKCNACGFAKEVLQKISDPLLSLCPSCGQEAFAKQLTAAGFQLKGSGWYATDFKGSSTPAGSASSSETKTETAPSATPAKPAPGGCGGACACHAA